MKNLFAFLACCSVVSCAMPGTHKNTAQIKLQQTAFPDYKKFEDFRLNVLQAQNNALIWVIAPGASDAKPALKQFVSDYYPSNSSILKMLEQDSLLPPGTVNSLSAELEKQNRLFSDEMNTLSDVAAYNNPSTFLPVESEFLDGDGSAALVFKNVRSGFETIQKALDTKMDGLLSASSQ